MKRLFIILCLILSLVACTEKMRYIELDDYPIDMTGYIGMTDDHHFSGLMPEEMLRCKEEGGSGIFYMGNTGCIHCQNTVSIIEKVASDLNLDIYYINTANGIARFEDQLLGLFEGRLMKNDQGKEELRLPMVFTLQNGDLKDVIIGETTYEDLKKVMEPFIQELS